MSSFQKRRKPNFYSSQKSKKRREFVLKPGLKGFLCTCNSREKDCIRESYNILNEYADNLYGVEKSSTTDETTTTPGASSADPETHESESEEEIENALNKELDSLKAERTKQPDLRRFQVVESGANNCIFIQTTVKEPVELVHHIMKDLEATRKQKTRFLLRLLPIEVTCKAYLEDIRQAADGLFDKYFTKEGKTFAVLFNRRNSSGVNREDIIHDLAEMVLRRNPDNRADLKHPQLAVLVEVIRNMCCLSVLPDYFELRKYNLLELCAPEGGIKITGSKDRMTDVQDSEKKDESHADTGGGGEGGGSDENKSEESEANDNQKDISVEDSRSENVGDEKGDCNKDTAPEASKLHSEENKCDNAEQSSTEAVAEGPIITEC